MFPSLHPSWQSLLAAEFSAPYWIELMSFVNREYAQNICFPESKDIFKAFDVTPFDRVKVVILGQDPYHTPVAAMGLSFSVPNGSRAQPSLRNIFRELEGDLGVKRTQTDLTDWAEQGVLLLNAVLTVRNGEPASHQNKGWENFTNAIITSLSEKGSGIVFILWGKYALEKKDLIDVNKHHIITNAHPSPFSAYRGFFGSRPFSRTNEYLKIEAKKEILWA